MGIVQLPTQLPSQVGLLPATKKMVTTDNLATVTTAGYLNSVNLEGNPIAPSDVLEVIYDFNQVTNTGTYEVFIPTIANGVITLTQWTNPGDVLLPATAGDFAIFNGSTGQIKDTGIAPSNPAKTKVVMANGAVVVGHIGVFTDVAGTLGEDAATAINAGNIQAGLSTGTAGTLGSMPGAATSGELILAAVTNSGGNFNTTISNAASVGQSQVVSIPDSGAAAANFIISKSAGTQHITVGGLQVDAGALTSGISTGGFNGTVQLLPTTTGNGSLNLTAVNAGGAFNTTISNGVMGQSTVYTIPDIGAATGFLAVSQSASVALAPRTIVRTITATAAALATAGHVAVQVHPSATSQFTIVDIKVMYAAAGLSGGGGNRLLNLTDGTIVFNQAGITAALLGTPVYTLWGGTGNPLPGSVSTISTAGADIYLVYAGGTTDYTTGQIVVQITLAQVTA